MVYSCRCVCRTWYAVQADAPYADSNNPASVIELEEPDHVPPENDDLGPGLDYDPIDANNTEPETTDAAYEEEEAYPEAEDHHENSPDAAPEADKEVGQSNFEDPPSYETMIPNVSENIDEPPPEYEDLYPNVQPHLQVPETTELETASALEGNNEETLVPEEILYQKRTSNRSMK